MTNIIIALGWFGFALALMYFLVYDQMSGDTNPDYVYRTRDILMASGALVIFGYVLKHVLVVLGVGYGKCKRCGKRIEKGEAYCFDHRRDVIWQAKDKTHDA